MDAGELVVKTLVDTKGADKGLKELRKKLENSNKELEQLMELKQEKSKMTYKDPEDWQGKTIKEYDYNEAKKRISELGEELKFLRSEEGKSYRTATTVITREKELETLKEQVAEYDKLQNQIKKVTQEQYDYANAIKKAEDEIKRSEITDVFKKQTKEIGKSIKQIAKMGLAIFGIRSAYMMVRSAISIISQDDAQLKADIDYIRKALAYSLEPIVRTIVNLAKELMIAIQRIAYVITGKNIFENANKNLAKASGSAKEIRKQLAGFDEMNVLSSSNGGGGTTKPSIDLSKMNELTDTSKGFLTILTGIAGVIASIKFAQLIKWLGLLGALPLWQLILGIGGVIGGIAIMTFNFLEYINDPSWKNFGQILQGIGIALAGIGVLFGAWPVAIAGAIVLVIGLIAQFWEKIEKFLVDLQTNIYKVGDNIVNWLHKHLGLFGDIIGAFISTLTGLIAGVVDIITTAFGGIFNFIKGILDSIVLLFKGQFKDSLKTAIKSIGNLFIDTLNTIISALNTVISPVRALIVEFGKITGKNWTMDNIKIPKIPRLAKGGILNAPGRGIPIGNAIAGEKGPEAVIPLTDDTLQRLANMIPITVNVTNSMNGRVLSRELQKVQNQSDFAMNR